MVLAGAAEREFKDPIIYSTHPKVSELLNSKKISGSAHDHENSVSLYRSMPAWISEDDEKNSNNLKYLTQILASYFDDLYLQIEKLPRLKDINYADDTNYEKPLPFADRLLDSHGYNPPELFADASLLAKYLERDEKKLFEKKLYEVKNMIYQNVYNNLSFIQKSKGTYKSLRNFLRCFGVDEELIKLNIYSNQDKYNFKDNVSQKAVQKKYIDFDDLDTRLTAAVDLRDTYTATAYQYYDVRNSSNSLSYIPGANAATSVSSSAMMTIETEVIFPKRAIGADVNYNMFPSLTSSIFGLHAVQASNDQLTFDPIDPINFNVVAIKTDNDLRNVKFALQVSGAAGTGSWSPSFTEVQNTSSIAAVYDNEKWNFAFRLRPTKSKVDTTPMKTSEFDLLKPHASAYTYELYGVNYLSDILQNEFTLSGTMTAYQAGQFFAKPKRLFIGAARQNFTGSVRRYSDVKISSTRVWLDYLSDETVRAHARDPNSYGALQPYRNTNETFNTNYVPQISTLVLNWTMDNLTGSNDSGQFLIEDFASGSTENSKKFGDHWAQPLSRYNYAGRGDKFMTNTKYSDQTIDLEYPQAAKLRLPEIVNSDDMVKILNKQDDVVFTRDTTYVQHLLSVEKSMYQTVSEEMLRMFASLSDFNNLVGEPVNRYRQGYKKLEKLRQLFFENVENERLDLEKFIEYYKWVDDAVTIMIAQLIPASSNSVEMLRNMVESHVLERNKYFNKFPTLEMEPYQPISSLKGIEELKYNWKFGHAPVAAEQNTNQDQNCLWWKQRAEREGVLTAGVDGVDDNKNIILKSAVTEVSGFGVTVKTSTGTKYAQTYYNNRSLARPIDIEPKRILDLKAGSNSKHNNLHDYYKNVIKWGSDDHFIYLDVDNQIKETVCNDKEIPDELNKKHFNFKALTMTPEESKSDALGTGIDDKKYSDTKSTLILPFSVISGSVGTGYQKLYSDQFKIDFTNLHDDKYGPHADIPLQGPFAEKYVGGMQHRHIALNQGSDTAMTRAEGWHLQEFLDFNSSTDGKVYFQEKFANAPAFLASTDPNILSPAFTEDVDNDPSPYEYWRNGVGASKGWSFIQGPTPTLGTGPASGYNTPGYAFAEASALHDDIKFKTYSLVTPLIDWLDYDANESPRLVLEFRYHMHGNDVGTLKIQASTDPDFEADVVDLEVRWSTLGNVTSSSSEATSISTEQHASPASAWLTLASCSTHRL